MKQFSYPRLCYGLLSSRHLHSAFDLLVVLLDLVMGGHFSSASAIAPQLNLELEMASYKRKVMPGIVTACEEKYLIEGTVCDRGINPLFAE
jgi:hypothetical protein